VTEAHGILGDVSVSFDPEVPPVRLPGQRELPSEDGEPMETQRHYDEAAYLIHAIESATRDQGDVYAAGNMFVYFSPRQLKNEFFRGPDVFVVVGAEKKERLSWVLWEEMRLPDVVIELTSPSTRDEDYGKKKDIYERVWKTATYVIYDPATHQLDAWELDGGRYVPLAKDERGDVEVKILGMRLGMRPLPLSSTMPAPSLRWIDASGDPLPTLTEVTARADAETARADAATARADAAEARAAALDQELERLKRG
jgi:Uma2 family endonuclease